MSKKEIAIRTLYAFIGVAVLALGATFLREGNVGLDPFTSANIALGGVFGLSLGVYQLLVNLVILVAIFIFGRKYIGIGTVVNVVLAGFFIDLFTEVFSGLGVTANSMVMQGVFLLVGIVLFTFGASFYMSADLGNAPYDAIAPTIVDHTGWQYRVIRVIQDVAFTMLAFFFQGPVGIGTFINAFCTGPLISLWNNRVSVPLIEKSVGKNK